MKTYLITGATSGIGEACARRCLEQGNQVVAICRDLAKAQAKFGDEISAGTFVPLEYDLSNCDKLYQFCLTQLQPFKIDRFIHCAGIPKRQKITSVTYEETVEIFEIHVFSLMEIVKAILHQRTSDQELSILALSSSASSLRLVQNGIYGMAKNGVDYYVQILNKQINAIPRRLSPDSDDLAKAELIIDPEQREKALAIAQAKSGLLVRINALAPSLIFTPLVRYDLLLSVGKNPPLIPIDIVINEIFLIIENKYMSGQIIVLNNNLL